MCVCRHDMTYLFKVGVLHGLFRDVYSECLHKMQHKYGCVHADMQNSEYFLHKDCVHQSVKTASGDICSSTCIKQNV